MPPSKKQADPLDEEPDDDDDEPDEDTPELEVVEDIPHVSLTKAGRPRKQMSAEVKARNAENLVIARAKAAALKKAQSAINKKEEIKEKVKKEVVRVAKNKKKEEIKESQDDKIAAYEQDIREQKIEKLEKEVAPKTAPIKKKKKAVVILEQEEDESDVEEIVVKTRRTKRAPPPLPPPDIVARVPEVPVPKVYTDEEVAKLKQQKAQFEKEQKKRDTLMRAIFN